MTRILLSYFNYDHGGRTANDPSNYANPNYYSGDGGPFDYGGLVRAMQGDDWPHILVQGEGDRYEYNGMEGAWEAARAMREAGGRPYIPLLGSLPREGGPFAPVVYVDPQVVCVRRWYDHRCSDFASRNRNLLVWSLKGRTDWFRLIAVHGDIHSGERRLADAREMDRFANPEIPCAILGDFNSTMSGPMWEETDLNDHKVHDKPWRLAWRILWEHGPTQAGPHQPDTRALDFLCGYWKRGRRDWRSAWLSRHPSRRAGGIGFYNAAELAQDFTPTQLPRPTGRQARAIDGILLNQIWADAAIPGSYTVHQPVDPQNPDSDHLRVSVAIDV